MMRRILPGIIFVLICKSEVKAQSYFQVAAGVNHSFAFSNTDYRWMDYATSSRYLIDLSYSDFSRTHFGLNYNVQFLHRDVSGKAVSGGLGSGISVSGYGNVSYLFFGVAPEWVWGNRFRFHTQIGMQFGIRVQSFAEIKTSTYGPIFNNQVLTAKDLFRPTALRIPFSLACSYPITKKISLGLRYQVALDIRRLGTYFANFRHLDESLLLCFHVPVNLFSKKQ